MQRAFVEHDAFLSNIHPSDANKYLTSRYDKQRDRGYEIKDSVTLLRLSEGSAPLSVVSFIINVIRYFLQVLTSLVKFSNSSRRMLTYAYFGHPATV